MQTAPRDSSDHSEAPEADEASLSTPHSLARALTVRRSEYMGQRKVRVKVASWNTAGCPGTDKDVGSWLFSDEKVTRDFAKLGISKETPSKPDGEPIDIYVVGLQEVVDLNTTKEYVNRVYAENHSQINKWRHAIEAAIPPGYEFVATEQMVGLLTLVYASTEISKHITNVSTQQVGTGLLGYFGNKGAVAIRIVLGETCRMVFVNSHLASGAGSSYLDRRCWDVGQIISKIQFDPVVNNGVVEDAGDKFGDEDFTFWLGDLNFRLGGLPGDDIRRILTLHTRGEYDVSSGKPPKPLDGEPVIVMKDSESDSETATASSLHSREQSFDSETSLPDPDDFPDDPSQDPASLQATLDSLLPHDQLRQVIRDRKAFHDGWKEGPITFLPTYKYDVGSVALFDSSEKQRAPSWCDRILYRTREYKQAFERKTIEEAAAKKKDEEMKSRGIEADEDVLFSYDPEEDGEEQGAESSADSGYEYDEYDEAEDQAEEAGPVDSDRVELELYMSYQRVTSSDHKPLTSIFTLTCDCVVPEEKAKVHAEVARQLDRAENEGRPVITLVLEGDTTENANVVDMGDMSFLSRKTHIMTIANTGGVPASFSFVDRPADDSDSETPTNWLKKSFTKPEAEIERAGPNVTLQPGETVTAILDGQVSSVPFLRALNDGHASIEEVLVLRVENGRDHFITVRANWLPSCFGRSIDELIRVPDGGIRKFLREKEIRGAISYDSDVHCSAPRELFKLTEAIQTLAERCIADANMLEDMELPGDAGWPFDAGAWPTVAGDRTAIEAAVIEAMDNDKPISEALPVEIQSSQKLELLSSVLLLFLASLTDGLVTASMCAKLATTIPSLTALPQSAWADMKVQILDVLSGAPNHNIAFVFLTSTLARVAKELIPATAESRKEGLQRRLSFRKGELDGALKKRRARERRYAEVFAPLAFRGGAGGEGRDKAARDKERAMLELFLSLEMQD